MPQTHKNEGIHLLEEFVCDAIAIPPGGQPQEDVAAPAKDAIPSSIHVLIENAVLVAECDEVGDRPPSITVRVSSRGESSPPIQYRESSGAQSPETSPLIGS